MQLLEDKSKMNAKPRALDAPFADDYECSIGMWYPSYAQYILSQESGFANLESINYTAST